MGDGLGEANGRRVSRRVQLRELQINKNRKTDRCIRKETTANFKHREREGKDIV